jgi:hypothetical protein
MQAAAEADDPDLAPRMRDLGERGHVVLAGDGTDRGFALADRGDALLPEQEEESDERNGDEDGTSEIGDVEAVHESLRVGGGLRLASEPGHRILSGVDGQRREDGEAESAADLLRRVVEPDVRPASSWGFRSSR